MSNQRRKNERWDINEEVGRKFLQVLDPDPLEAEARYERIRRKLILYISRHLGSIKQGDPDDLADETIRRAARKIGEEGVELTGSVEQYCYGIAYHVLQEYWDKAKATREKEEQLEGVPNIPAKESAERPPIKNYLDEQNLACLRRCLKEHFSKLEIAAILRYHDLQPDPGQTKQIRKTLAKRFKTSPKNLANRMDRHREKLLRCIKLCLDENTQEKKSFDH